MALTAVMTTLAACSQDDDLQDAAPKATSIEFEITDGGYADAQTRAVEDGYRTKFVAGDVCGLCAFRNSDGNICTNVKLTAEDGDDGKIIWKAETDDIASQVLGWDKYFIYYPYREKIDATIESGYTDTDVFENLISSWTPETDQSTYANYTASDLMTAEGTATKLADNKLKISFSMTHRMALAEIAAPVEVDFSNSTNCTPYKAEDWKYRFIVNPMKVEDGTCIKGKIGSKTFTINSDKLNALKTGQYKTFKVGSSYYVDAEGTYHVYTAEGLKAWAEALNTNYATNCTLEKDITMPTVADGESNWTPAGHSVSKIFNGTFDGNGHTISGLVINQPEISAIGFIRELRGTVKNLTLKDARITGFSVGAIAYSVKQSGTIENCHVTGTSVITGSDGVGGIASSIYVDYSGSPAITACHVSDGCTVTGTEAVGGIVGELFNGGIKACYALCSLNGSSKLGGICGFIIRDGLTFTACYSICKFPDNAATSVGGIVGGKENGIQDNKLPNFSACYWAGTNVSNGVGYADRDPDGVEKANGSYWNSISQAMNTKLTDIDYWYVYTQSTTEPSVLRKRP